MPSRRLEVPADPLRLARALAREPGAFLAWDGPRAYLGCRPLARSTELDPEPTLSLDPTGSPAPRWFGLLPYEAFRTAERTLPRDERSAPLIDHVVWHRYGAVARVEGGEVVLEGDDPGSLAALESLLVSARSRRENSESSAHLELIGPVEEPERHADRVRHALEQIAQGNLYQVNLARRFEFRVSGDPFTLLEALGEQGRCRFTSAGSFDSISWVSTSPELFLSLSSHGELATSPIKGTRPRGATPEEDARLSEELDGSEKERAELAMVIDVERNDLGRVAVAGSVRLSDPPRVVTHPSVHHREATVTATLRPGVSRSELLTVTLPSGSVTGAPKLRAMELIATLEAERRGLYTGALGWLGHDGSLRLSMAIRTLTFRDGYGHYYSGGGIVADSDPAAEVEETLWKARQLAALGSSLGAG